MKPFIPSGNDFAAARQFFRDLGFVVNWEVARLAELQLGGAVFLLQEFHNPTVHENPMMSAKVDDLDAWWEHLIASGVLERYLGVRAGSAATSIIERRGCRARCSARRAARVSAS